MHKRGTWGKKWALIWCRFVLWISLRMPSLRRPYEQFDAVVGFPVLEVLNASSDCGSCGMDVRFTLA